MPKKARISHSALAHQGLRGHDHDRRAQRAESEKEEDDLLHGSFLRAAAA